jgi:hypothetical protein
LPTGTRILGVLEKTRRRVEINKADLRILESWHDLARLEPSKKSALPISPSRDQHIARWPAVVLQNDAASKSDAAASQKLSINRGPARPHRGFNPSSTRTANPPCDRSSIFLVHRAVPCCSYFCTRTMLNLPIPILIHPIPNFWMPEADACAVSRYLIDIDIEWYSVLHRS